MAEACGPKMRIISFSLLGTRKEVMMPSRVVILQDSSPMFPFQHRKKSSRLYWKEENKNCLKNMLASISSKKVRKLKTC